MAQQVFVSYATEDAKTASCVCALLEADGIQCWIAPRDVKAGTDYAAAIMDAIRNAQLVVLVFSTHSNASPYALREIERSVAYGRPVLALRIDRADPTSSLEYYLHHWIEAPEGVESKRTQIISAVREQLARPPTAATSTGRGAVPAPRPPVSLQPSAGKAAAKARSWYQRTWVIALAAIVVVAAAGLGLGLGLTRSHTASQAATMGNHVAWTEFKPSGTLPLARSDQAMAYDPTAGRLIMFGGSNAVENFGDVWAYNPTANTWNELKPSGTLPAARSAHAMAYDPGSRSLIVFGGGNDNGTLNDTWAYDPVANTWTELKPSRTLPSARSGHAMAYDPGLRGLIMFGGFGDIGTLNDTWAYDPVANAWNELKPSRTLPSARSGHAMAYDPGSRRLIMFGGSGDSGAPFDDTWAYDPVANTWNELKPSGAVPSARSGHSMAYDPTSGRLIMFGGVDFAGTSLDDTWAYDSATNAWTQLEASGPQPRARAGHVMAYDQTSARLIMFGGHSIRPTDLLNETWTCVPS